MLTELDLESQVQWIREFELAIADEYPKGEMRCPVHLSIGQERAAVGVMSQLTKQDLVVSTHRSHAHYLAKGGDPYRMLCELYGKADGCSRGQGGSMHLVDWDAGFAGSTSIVGGTIPVGVGLAFAAKVKKETRVVAVCLGDAALEEGIFHESANFAALHKLPVLFVVENNGMSCYTKIEERQPKMGEGVRPFEFIASAHALQYAHAFDTLTSITNSVRYLLNNHLKHRPCFLEITVDRLVEHCGHVVDKGVPTSNRFTKDIQDLFNKVKASPYPDESELGKYLYA